MMTTQAIGPPLLWSAIFLGFMIGVIVAFGVFEVEMPDCRGEVAAALDAADVRHVQELEKVERRLDKLLRFRGEVR